MGFSEDAENSGELDRIENETYANSKKYPYCFGHDPFDWPTLHRDLIGFPGHVLPISVLFGYCRR